MAFRKLFQGERVDLVPLTAEDRDLMAKWSADSEYFRNLDDDPVRPMNAAHYEDWIGGATKQHAEYQGFAIVAKTGQHADRIHRDVRHQVPERVGHVRHRHRRTA